MVDQFSQQTSSRLGETSQAMDALSAAADKALVDARNQAETLTEINEAIVDVDKKLAAVVSETKVFFDSPDTNSNGYIEKETAQMLSQKFDGVIESAEDQLDLCDDLHKQVVENRKKLQELNKKQDELIASGQTESEEFKQNEEEIKALKEKNDQAEKLEREKRHQAALAKKTSLEYKDKLDSHAEDIQNQDKDNLYNSVLDKPEDIAALAAGAGAGFGLDGIVSGISSALTDFTDNLSSQANNFMSGMGQLLGGAINSLDGFLQTLQEILNNSVNSATDLYSNYLGEIDARLFDGSNPNAFEGILSDVRAAVGSSLLINQKTLIENIARFVDSGIDYNLEQRALLATLSEDMVPTFNALDATLSRMVRLQQADMTLSQMGLEAKLQQVLLNTFKDSSFLGSAGGSGLYDSVYEAITNALSTQADTDQMTQFTYAIEKWMGGLYSVGMSTEAINSFANAINALGTGDINKLGDSAANTLMAMVANRAGLSYASLLTEGLTADTTNELLKAMVEYLQDIATNTNSNVVKSEWGNILNLQMSDWKAIQNITNEDITKLYNSVVTQQDAQNEISTQIETVLGSRIHLSEQIDNAIENTMMNFGMSIASNAEDYATWKLMNVANSITSQIGGQYLGSITNLLSEGYTFSRFGNQILQIPKDLFDTLANGENGIGNLMAGYQFTMDRGNMQSGEGSGISESSTMNRSIWSLADMDDLEADDLDIVSSLYKSNGIFASVMDMYKGRDEELEDAIEDTATVVSDVTTNSVENMETITNNAADYQATTLQQQSETLSATSQNIISQEASMIRDINDLYAELFERRSIPIRVALAQVEAQAQGEIRSAIEGITVEISGDEFAALANMRG